MADTKSIAAIQVGVDQTLTYPGKSILQKWEVFCQVLSSCVVCTPSQRWSQFRRVDFCFGLCRSLVCRITTNTLVTFSPISR